MLNKLATSVIGKGSITKKTKYNFAGLFSKRKPLSKDLDFYDVIIVGGNIGGIFSRHWDEQTHGHFKTMAIFDNGINQQYPMRIVYEQQRATKTDYLPNSKLAINMYTAHSDTIGIDSIDPEKNHVVLRNGRKIGYDHIVLAMGMNENLESIANFEDAWKDLDHPVFTCKDHNTWRAFSHKYPRYLYNFVSGDAIFCIPPYPFAGEVETYNFFISDEIWKWYKNHGKLSPNHSITIVNANDKFVQFQDDVDKFIKDELARRGLNVEYGLNLVGVDKATQTATFENVRTKERSTRPYNNLYSLIPSKPHPSLLKAGLISKESNYLLDVCPKTLRHKKYKNIFGLGDVCNLPTTKTFWAGYNQVHVVRENLDSSLHGRPMVHEYDGFSKVPLFLGQNSLTYLSQYYDKPTAFNLLDKSRGPLSRWRYYVWGKGQKRRFLGYYLFKTWGPPFYKLTKLMKLLKRFPKRLAEPVPTEPRDAHGHGHHGGADRKSVV